MTYNIPEATAGALARYVEHHLPVGGFLQAVLENNLASAVCLADPKNLAALPEIVRAIVNETPGDCHGSPDAVKRWLRLRPKEPKPDPAAIPAALQTAEFINAWDEWNTYRSERKLPLSPTGVKRQLARLAEMGPALAVAAIHHSIAQQYRGIFPPHQGKTSVPPAYCPEPTDEGGLLFETHLREQESRRERIKQEQAAKAGKGVVK